MITTSNHLSEVNITGFTIDGANIAAAGIYLDTALYPTIKDNTFIRFNAGTKALTGGSILFGVIERNTFSGTAGFGFDFQAVYAGTSTYYGCNQCWFSHNSFGGETQGNRTSGNTVFRENDVEGSLDSGGSPGLVAFGDPVSGVGFFDVSDNYMELGSGTLASPIGFTVTGSGGKATFNRNELHGIAAGAGIVSNGLPGSISGNWLWNWGTCIDVPAISDGNASSITIQDNSFSGCSHNYSAPVGTSHFNGTPNLYAGEMVYDSSRGWVFSKRAIVPSVTRYSDSDGTSLSARYGNGINLNYSTPQTISVLTDAVPGMIFTIQSSNGNATLANSTFHLVSGADFLMPTDRALWFMVDYNGVVREIGSSK